MSSLSTLVLYSDLCLSFKCLSLSLKKKKLHTCIYFSLQPFLCLLALEFSSLTAKSFEGQSTLILFPPCLPFTFQPSSVWLLPSPFHWTCSYWCHQWLCNYHVINTWSCSKSREYFWSSCCLITLNSIGHNWLFLLETSWQLCLLLKTLMILAFCFFLVFFTGFLSSS